MKRVHFIYSLIILLLAFSACATQKHNQPTRTYSSSGQDTLLMEDNFINLDSTRILIVDFSNATEGMTYPEEWTTNKNGADFISHIGGKHTSGSSYMNTEVGGNVQSQFSDKISINRTIDKLRSLADVVVVQNKNVNRIENKQLDSIAKKWNVDLVIALDYIHYNFNQETAIANYAMDRLFYPEHSTTNMSYNKRSYNAIVRYISCWNLTWIDKANHSVSKKEKIIQVGQYHNTNEIDPRADILSCAIKAADDFISVFK